MLRVGYQCAVEFRNWKLEGDKTTLGTLHFILSVKVYRVNEFWVTQTPKDLGLYLGDSVWWMWENVQTPHHRDIRPGTTIGIPLVGEPIIVPRF